MHNISSGRRDETVLDAEPATASPEAAPLPTAILIEAIARKQCVIATYNRQTMLLAPHIVYSKHGDLFVDAVTVEREGKPPREIKLGAFKLAGLTGIALSRRPFAINTVFDAGDFKYADAVFAVQA